MRPPATLGSLQELERTRAERSAAFSRLSRGLAEVDALYAQRCAEIWAGVAGDFGAPAGGGGGGGGGGSGGASGSGGW